MAAIRPAPLAGETSLTQLKSVLDLLDQYCRFATRNLVDVQTRLRELPYGVRLSIDQPTDFDGYREVVLSIGELLLVIGSIDSSSGYDLSFKSGEEYIVTIPLRGSGWVSTGGLFLEYGRYDVVIVAPLCRVEKHWEGPGEVLSIHVPVDRFDAALRQSEIQAPLSSPILRIDNRKLRSFMRVVDMVCDDLRNSDSSSPFLHSPISDHAEGLILSLLLEELRPEPVSRPHPASISPAVPYYVRRAERFIATNAHISIGIGEIADAAGVSPRTVQYGFRKFLSTTPMQYLKRTRFDRARAMLLSEGSGRKISEIALDIGCHNISQFSREYRCQFGESPSDTVGLPRSLVARNTDV